MKRCKKPQRVATLTKRCLITKEIHERHLMRGKTSELSQNLHNSLIPKPTNDTDNRN